MNDAHIYCTEEQVIEEFTSVMNLHREYYELFGFKDFSFRLSTWDPDDPKGKEKYVDDPEGWDHSQDIIRRAMK
jgi:threonyl-tRNA synthetase